MSWFWIWPTLVAIGLALLGYLAYRLAPGSGVAVRPATPDSARQILDERYTRGEIDEQDYQRRRAALR